MHETGLLQCYSVWSHEAKHRPLRVQKSLASCLAPCRSFNSRLRSRLHWLPVQERITLTIATLTHRVLTSRLPLQLIAEYRPAYNLRSADNSLLVRPRTKTKIVSRAFRVSAPTIWNSLPFSLRCATASIANLSHLFDSMYSWSLTFLLYKAPLTHCTDGNSILRMNFNHGAPQNKFDWLIKN